MLLKFVACVSCNKCFFYQSQKKSTRRQGAVIGHHNTVRFSERSVDRMQLLEAKIWGYIFSFTQQTTKAYSVSEIFTLLGFYSVQIASSLPTFWDNLSVPYSRSKQSRKDILECFTLEDGTDRSSRIVGTKLSVYAGKIPEERRYHLHCRGSLKSVYPSANILCGILIHGRNVNKLQYKRRVRTIHGAITWKNTK